MRNLDGILDLRPSLVGSIAQGATAVGIPIDTIGFREVLAVLVAGAAFGTDGNEQTLDVKFQENASATDTGAGWTDITDGDFSGTFAFASVTINGTNQAPRMAMKYERLGAKRSRYIRAHATLSGTAGLSPKYSVALLLGKPNDTLYIAAGATQATGNVEYTVGA